MTKHNSNPRLSWRWPLAAAALAAWCQLLACPASAGEAHPLQPIDTSSPRATLQGFLETTNEGYAASSGLRQSYWSSSRLYFLPEEIATMRYALSRIESAERTLDLSELPSATVSESSRRRVVQLKEVLDRIDLPPMESFRTSRR